MINNCLQRKCWIFLIVIFGLNACVEKDSDYLFQQLNERQTNITFANKLTENEEFNIIEYLYFYNGGGVAVGDINNDGLPDIYFTANQLPNKLYLNKGNLQFEDITQQAGVAGTGSWKTGVTMADVNGDGWLDIYVCQVGKYKTLQGRNELFINNQDGTFSERAAEYGLDFQGFSTQAAFFDYDRDGDLDMYLLNHSIHSTDNYGKAHLRQLTDELTGDRLYRNDGGRFTNVTQESGIYSSKIGYGLGVATGDMNNDGWPDIYISNDFHENDYLYYNNGDGTFTEAGENGFGHTSNFSMGSDVGDFNNDGRLDVLTLDMKPEDEVVLKSSVGADPYNIYRFKLEYGYHYQFPRNMLQLNRGNLNAKGARFSEIAELAGVDATDWSWSALFCDLDNDGWKDIFISNGIWQRPNDLDYLKFTSNREVQQRATDLEMASKMPPGLVPNYAYRNQGDLTFEKVSEIWGLDLVGCSNGAAYADLDNDGDLDLVTNNLNAPATVFENRANEKLQRNYLKITLKDEIGKNPFGIGARVEVTANGVTQVQELFTTRGFQSSVEPLLFFGLGTANQVVISIRWATGDWQYLENVKPNQTLVIEKTPDEGARKPATTPLFEEITSQAGVNFIHQENAYVDFNQEKLIPHLLSTQGPKLAVGDVNGDSLEDFYVCGAAGQAGQLFIQGKNNAFKSVIQEAIVKDSLHEDVNALFFDADGDGDLDLYVVSGGGESGRPPDWYQDRLYLNDGQGNFIKAESALPQIPVNGSCVVAADFNDDGALDLFVGSRSVPGSYGLLPDSYLLLNDGKGKFTNAQTSELKELGMVTDAVWLAKEKTLVVVGEWMPVTFLNWRDGQFIKTEIPKSNGWWNTVHAADLDGDGDEDLLLGNLGLNCNLKASPEQPVELYVGDFDNNFYTDPLLTYYKQNKQYSYYTKDELFEQLTLVKKKFVDYAPFARSTFQEVFDAKLMERAQRRQVLTFASSFAENQGNGNFVLKALPTEAQLSPIFAFATGDFNEDGKPDVLATGNWHDLQPSMGRYDASFGVFLENDNKGGFKSKEPADSGFIVPGQGRDIKILRSHLIIVARNGLPIQLFTKADHKSQ